MSSYIKDNYDTLKNRHYIRMARTSDHWYDFRRGKLEKTYRTPFGDGFCLVIYASDTEDDAYVLPYLHIKHLFREEYLDDKQRWSGHIINNLLDVVNCKQKMSVSAYYNAFEYLEESDDEPTIPKELEVLYGIDKEIDLPGLAKHIRLFNEKYCQAAPHKHKKISEDVARPNAITDYLKTLRNYTCQVCRQVGFVQTNGVRYIETHHIIELHKLSPGSLCSDNIIVVCANCHRKFHYAHVVYKTDNDNLVSIEINGECFSFERNVISPAT